MIEVLEFIFQDFWHFVGTLLLLASIFPCIKIRIGKDRDGETKK